MFVVASNKEKLKDELKFIDNNDFYSHSEQSLQANYCYTTIMKLRKQSLNGDENSARS